MRISGVQFKENTNKDIRLAQTNPIMAFYQTLGNIKLNTLDKDIFVKQVPGQILPIGYSLLIFDLENTQ